MITKEDIQKTILDIEMWIRRYFECTGGTKAIIGISGGKDSTICAALCVRALGAENVIGVLMPDGEQFDIQDAWDVCEYLGITAREVKIGGITSALYAAVGDDEYNSIVKQNMPARIRMATLYTIKDNNPGSRVCNTSNASETYVGYDTRYGDDAGDFSPLKDLTVTEARQIGLGMYLPKHMVNKKPHDGMCGSSDEARFGFTYEQLDDHIRGEKTVPTNIVDMIEMMHSRSAWKREDTKQFHYQPKKLW